MASLSAIIRRLIGDTQERLLYRARVFIRDCILGYRPSKADLDYPNKLASHSKHVTIDRLLSIERHYWHKFHILTSYFLWPFCALLGMMLVCAVCAV